MADFATRRRMMVDTQIRPSDVTLFPVIEAMLSIPRERFVPNRLTEAAYIGESLPIGRSRVFLDPRTLAKMLNALELAPTDLVLDIGPGYGYSTAVIAHMAQAVVAVEPDEPLVAEASAALAEIGADNASVEQGIAAEGLEAHAPYDVILVQGAVEQIPAKITDQLAEGGRICAIFREDHLGVCKVGVKNRGVVSWRFAFNASAPVMPGFETVAEFTL
ncbi:protein-L-isoaspartate O-methyltransferase family protein [Palleronia caenipelagi]|uniref:Protein-L-isoaspartate O-methyltransferase n=1 Tax=Palleronia caenipelagi TaxID=2489174 RepID=A0A547PY07_9RHOB|nr:protein-L-isoaspartate O-methyltransferase [Palleronia caenipelagi]TRD19033.1 protein-L-isoaspartate O-methyltransferase [Palleronia caenipelagi]